MLANNRKLYQQITKIWLVKLSMFSFKIVFNLASSIKTSGGCFVFVALLLCKIQNLMCCVFVSFGICHGCCIGLCKVQQAKLKVFQVNAW